MPARGDAAPTIALSAAAVGLLVGAVAVANLGGLMGAAVALALAVGLTLTVAVGPERLGFAAIAVAMFTSPQNAVRPVPSADFVTVADLMLLVGAVLVTPALLRRRPTFPVPWALGALLLATMVLVSFAVSATPVSAANYGIRLLAAAVMIPLFFLLWGPQDRQIDVLVWSYVAGHVVSTGYALVEGRNVLTGRFDGLTTHFNFFGLSALVATCLVLHLWSRTTPSRRWVVVAAGLVCVASVLLSGSRAAALVIAMIALVHPVLERSLAWAFALVAGTITLFVAGGPLLSVLGEGSAVGRLGGDSTTTTSDRLRVEALEHGVAEFLRHPILGSGFDETALFAHNIYLQVAIGVGIIGALGYVAVLAASVLPLLRPGPMRRLGYVGLGYVTIGVLTNSLWDRFVWMGVALAIVASVTRDDSDQEETAPQAQARHVTPISSVVRA